MTHDTVNDISKSAATEPHALHKQGEKRLQKYYLFHWHEKMNYELWKAFMLL